MAVNVDTVYQKVLAIANKEQRGYITPQEFNLFANQAQLDIFERYFYDMSGVDKGLENDTEYANTPDILEEKLSHFRVNDYTVYPTDFRGTVALPTDLYRLGEVSFRHKTLSYPQIFSDVEVEEIKKKDIGTILRSRITRPSIARPVFVRLTNSTIQIYPNRRDTHNTDITFKSDEAPARYWKVVNCTYSAGTSTIITTDDQGSYVHRQFDNSTGTYPKVIGTGIPDDTIITDTTGNNMTWTLSNVLTSSGTDVTVYVAEGNTRVNYIKKPTDVNWAYTEINGTALYNSGNSTNFELHASEESMLVSKILQLAGISLKDGNLIQVSGTEEMKLMQQQKQ